MEGGYGKQEKNQVMADLSPGLPSPEDRVQKIVCKSKGKRLDHNQDVAKRVRNWVGPGYKQRQWNCTRFLVLLFAQVTPITQCTTNLMA